MKTGSIKLRRVRGGVVSIRATGDVAKYLVGAVGGATRRMLEGHRLRLRFVDEGQDVLAWELDAEGRITRCTPCQAAAFVGAQVHGIPAPGEQPVFSLPRSTERRRCAWTVEAVELLP